jgi:hypothetical protein
MRKIFSVLVCAVLLQPSSLIAEPLLRHLSWQPYPHAVYYKGSYFDGQLRRLFRTSSHWVLVPLPQELPLTIVAYDISGKRLGKVAYGSRAISAACSPTSLRSAPKQAVPNQVLVTGDSENTTQNRVTSNLPSSDENLETTERTYDKALNFLDVDDPYASPLVQKKAKAALKSYKRPASLDIFLTGGLGLEKLASSGGLSYYTGASSIGSTQVQMDLLYPPGLFLSGRAEGHYFETVETLKVGDNAKNESFERITLDLKLGLDGIGRPDILLLPYIGGTYLKMPVLAQVDGETSRGIFKNKIFKTLGLGIRAEVQILSHHGLGGEIFGFPLLASSELKGYEAETFYRYYFSSSWIFVLSFQWSLHQSFFKIPCPEIEECQNTSQTTLNNRLWLSGFGYRW